MAQKKHEYPDEYYEERLTICKEIIKRQFPEIEVNTVPWAMIFCELFGKVTVNKRFKMHPDEVPAEKQKKGKELDWENIEKGMKT
jgi:hypothetical protein